jgi:hemolysin activation/secretion protein
MAAWWAPKPLKPVQRLMPMLAGVLVAAASSTAQAQAQAEPAAAPTVPTAPAAAPTDAAGPQAKPQAAATVAVSGYQVLGNTLLPAADIEARLVPFKGVLTVQRLRDAAAAVQDLYRRAGYGGVVAFLPEQALGSGVVVVRVVEGKLDRIDISGLQQFTVDNLLASLPDLVKGRTPNVRRIDAQIQLANESPAKTVQVLLQPGSTPGTVAAKLTVAEQPVQRWTARADNTGSRSNGRWRAALGWQHGNVLGQDHVFSTEWQTAPEDVSGVAVLSAAYRVPLYQHSVALDAYGAFSDVSSAKTSTAAGDLQFSGRGHIVGARGTLYLPRWDTLDHRVSLGLESRDYLNDCSIAGLPAGACGSAGASVSLQPLSLAYTAQAGGELRAGVSVSLHHNLGLGGSHTKAEDFEAVRAGAVRRYTLLRGSGQVSLPVQEWGTLALRVSAQASGQPLVPGELFGVGGAQSVRGFEERELAGDSGLQASAEFTSPNLADKLPGLKDAELRVLVFADGGYVSSLKGAPCLPGETRCHMASVGAGLRLAYSQALLRLDLGTALTDATTTARGDVRLHLGLSVSF